MSVVINHRKFIVIDGRRIRDEHITIEDFAVFPVNGGSVSVWALPEFDL